MKDLKCEDIIELSYSCSVLGLDDLLNLCCAFLATNIKGKSVQEIRDIFGIENDFSAEEER